MTTEPRTRPRGRPRARPEQVGITAVSVRGYKSLADEISIGIRPLTILAGANSSGKSSVLQPLLLQKQTLEASYDPGALRIDGPHVRFTSAGQMVSRSVGKSAVSSFTVKTELDGSQTLTTTYTRRTVRPLDIAEMRHAAGDDVLLLRPGMAKDELRKAHQGRIRHIAQLLGGDPEVDFEVVRRRCFLSLDASFPSQRPSRLPRSLFAVDPASPFETRIQRIIHVPGLRGNPERTYKTTSFGAVFQGTFENYVASIIRHWQAEKDVRLPELGDALETLGLTWKVEARQVDDTQVELRVGRLLHSARGGARDLVNIADVGFGVSQTLPVLVALLAAEPSQLVYIEQPEIHLHPRAQQAMALMLATAANRGVRVVIETHSSLLLLAIQTLVAEGRLSPAFTQLHWFTRDTDGVTRVQSAELDRRGTYGDWPEDFGEVALEAESRYLDATESADGAK